MKSIDRRLFALLILIVMLALSGCGRINDYVKRKVTKSAEEEIISSEEYRQYDSLQTDGLLGDDGLFPMLIPSNSSDGVNGSQTVAVSLATNSFLSCTYYTDEETKTPITSSEVFLVPGESIYVENVTVNNDISNLYDFSRFRIWAYDQKGQRSATPYKEVDNISGLLLKIPEDFQGTGFSIEPLGRYSDRHISAKAYFWKDGQKIDLPSGSWEVNSKPFGENTDISPVDSYTIIYRYEQYKDAYYFVKSTPECWYSKESNHTVIFRESSSTEQNTEFTVEMHPYITLTIKNSCLSWAASIPVIGDQGKGIIQSITKGTDSLGQDHVGEASFPIPKLKVGDTISIRVGKDYTISGTGVNVGQAIPIENGYEYTIIVPDTNKEITIDISERNSNAEGRFAGYNLANAEVKITRANGADLTVGDELPGDDERVTLTITPHDGYYIEGYTEKDSYSFVKKNYVFSKLERDISAILNDHPATHFITLNLVFSDEYGIFTYKLDRKDVSKTTLENVRVGQTLKVDYKANSGYKISHSWFGSDAIHDAWRWAGGTDSISESIIITSDMNGATVDRATFNIIVEKAG